MKKILFILCVLINFLAAQTIEIGTFNVEWFPCKDDGQLMKKYGIDMKYPPTGSATDVKALFEMLKDLDIELLALEEIVDTQMIADSAKKYLGENYKYIFSPAGGSQKVGFLYDSSVLELAGQAESYDNILLKADSRLRPAFRAYFKTIPNGFDFHAVVLHLKASPRGWDQRKQQLELLEGILAELPEETKDADVIVMGDMNNVTDAGTGEFTPMLERLGFYLATQELNGLPSSYWQPNYKMARIQSSNIDHIFVSADAKIEFIENSVKVGGVCSEGKADYVGTMPEYYEKISDHCPVYASFKADKDDD